jgi:hypothetical protein
VSVTVVSCIVSSMAKTLNRLDYPRWKCNGGSGTMVCTTPPKEDKADTSLTKAPTGQALVARSRSKAPDDNLANDDPDLLNFDVVESKIICQTSSRQ